MEVGGKILTKLLKEGPRFVKNELKRKIFKVPV